MAEQDESGLEALTRRLTELSAERSYQNAERTLSVWARTALSLMIFGIAIDRFGLMLHQLPAGTAHLRLQPDALSAWFGIALVAAGVLMSVTTGARFLAYAAAYRRQYPLPVHHGPYLAGFFALLVTLFGIALLVVMLMVAD